MEDIPELANHFLRYFSGKENKPLPEISKAAMELLQQHPWKGNIRELRNVLQRACILTETGEIRPEHLPFEIQKQYKPDSNNLSLAVVEKNHIERVLGYTKGNKTKAAEYLGIGLTTLYRKIEEYHIPR
jgi:DNA-binding NtrC family response regulator